ncbi:XK-related protein 9 [Syngnathoides biaculeatus]|uniref:XK-related protein 9 n=1 Tax=Syngnathoides biaculeatus TaxID=300417 RepID=UPI002ADE90A1|nr:XK-related protein 9 [Syngnathoides biaculeatus]
MAMPLNCYEHNCLIRCLSGTDSDMLRPDIRFTKRRLLLTVVGLLLYLVDIWIDVGLSLEYLLDRHYIRSALTFSFVLAGLLVTQIFSHAWYEDDLDDALMNPRGKSTILGMSKWKLMIVHLCGAGIFTRYYHLLKCGFRVVWFSTGSLNEDAKKEAHHLLFCQATDLSMLKLFEAFLESAPQLLLQIYIVLGNGEASVVQYFSMVISFLNIAWALLDYRRCLRRSLPRTREMPSGIPTVVYFLYKLCTITSHILSYSLLLVLTPYCVIALVAILWLLGTMWSHLLRTNFCSTRSHEMVYRTVVGFILTFTFFNVKGQDTRISMTVYYFLYSLINVTSPLLLALLKPDVQTETFFLVISVFIFSGTVLGLVCLVLYYLHLHPREKRSQSDEVDGTVTHAEIQGRMSNFLQP